MYRNTPPPGFGLKLNVIKHFEDFEQLQMYLSGSTTQLLHLLLPLRTNQPEAKTALHINSRLPSLASNQYDK